MKGDLGIEIYQSARVDYCRSWALTFAILLILEGVQSAQLCSLILLVRGADKFANLGTFPILFGFRKFVLLGLRYLRCLATSLSTPWVRTFWLIANHETLADKVTRRMTWSLGSDQLGYSNLKDGARVMRTMIA